MPEGIGHNRRNMTEPELAAWNGLIQGDLGPLADLLAEGHEELHPILQRWLLRLIRGSSDETGFRIRVDKHPDLKRLANGPEAKRSRGAHELRTALLMRANGAFVESCWESAVAATARETGFNRSTIAGHWGRHRAFLKLCEEHGVLPASPTVLKNN